VSVSLDPEPIGPVPAETVRVAKAAYPAGNAHVVMRDELGPLIADLHLAHLFPKRGQPPERPWRLAMITVFQFVENPSDRHAADAVRGRLDWKYALGLELQHPGFDHALLSEFRSRLFDSGAERLLLDVFVEQFRQHGLLEAHGRQRTDSSQVLAALGRRARPPDVERPDLRRQVQDHAVLEAYGQNNRPMTQEGFQSLVRRSEPAIRLREPREENRALRR
jgi:transposase